MSHDGPISVYIMCSALGEAQEIARALVEERLAACCNILGQAKSIYRWEGAVETGAEFPVVAKTMGHNFDALAARVKALHGFSVPAITAWPIVETTPEYGAWIEENCRAVS
ncbi:divalent-cation tolerance protein CutA [Sphingomicrobium sediminis]|uniref:Divalent-cation tolerance protein CutA n=1 Tax=Sphingomicrobium sediminis TaxID=2950949 RepID=A0A9X2J0S1_9SPHN|nr:divalent-cation tolerance protein CutA [Sphingomicrobium sediminis]MCM8556553.1 divalent-cation tolerance protein CutA [Sphingomicrobium sediminis]